MTDDAFRTAALGSAPAAMTLRCRTVATGGFKQMNYIRGLPPLPVEERFGPPDEVPAATPPETLLAALGSCLSAHIHANAAAGGVTVSSLQLDVEADMAASPMWKRAGGTPGPVGFEVIRIKVHMTANASPDALRALIAHALVWSPVANTLHDPVHLDIALADLAKAGP